MRKAAFLFVLFSATIFLFSACRSEFETVRASGDLQLIYDKANAYYDAGDYQKAQTLYELIIGPFRGRPELEEIYFRYAYTYYYQEKYILAAYYFKNFGNTFSTSQYREEADFMVGYSDYQLSPKYRLDQQYTLEAIEEFQLYVNTYPNSERVDECNQLIDDMRKKLERKALESAKLYFDLRQYQAATTSFENLLRDFPESGNAIEVRFLIVKSAYLLADNSILEKQKERFDEMLEYAETFLKKYGDSAFANEVRAMVADAEQKINQIKDGRYQKSGAGAGS
jgi:outer membrane protein assembly factor BamD